MILRSSPLSHSPTATCHLPIPVRVGYHPAGCAVVSVELQGQAARGRQRTRAIASRGFTAMSAHHCGERNVCPAAFCACRAAFSVNRSTFFLALRVRSPSWCACVSVWDRRTPVCRCVFSVGLAADGLCEMTIQKTARVLTTLPGYYYNLYYYSSPHSGSTLQLYTHSSHIHPLV